MGCWVQIGREHQLLFRICNCPAYHHGPIAQHCVAATAPNTREARHDLLMSDNKDRGIPVEPTAMWISRQALTGKLARGKGLVRERVGNARAHCWILKFRKAREFFPATLANGVGQVRAEIAEKGKRLCCSPFFPHEQHGYLGEEQIGGRDGPQRVCRRDRSQPIAERPIADLIVVLNECDECWRRQAAARLPACVPTIWHELALKCEALRERSS